MLEILAEVIGQPILRDTAQSQAISMEIDDVSVCRKIDIHLR